MKILRKNVYLKMSSSSESEKENYTEEQISQMKIIAEGKAIKDIETFRNICKKEIRQLLKLYKPQNVYELIYFAQEMDTVFGEEMDAAVEKKAQKKSWNLKEVDASDWVRETESDLEREFEMEQEMEKKGIVDPKKLKLLEKIEKELEEEEENDFLEGEKIQIKDKIKSEKEMIRKWQDGLCGCGNELSNPEHTLCRRCYRQAVNRGYDV